MGAKVLRSDERHTREILDSIRRLVRSLREYSRAAEKKVGLSGAQLFVLQSLQRSGRLSLTEIAERTVTHQSSVSVVVSRLVARSLVARVRSSEDARRLELSITDTGRALLRRAPRVAQDRMIDGLRKMSARERRTLAASLHGLVAHMGIHGESPSMFFEEGER